MKKITDSSQGAGNLKVHEIKCPEFQIIGKIFKKHVIGCCSICGEILEDHGRKGEHEYKTEE